MRKHDENPDRVPGGGWINPSGVPEPLASVIKQRERGRPKVGSISVTELIQPPRVRVLKSRYWDHEHMTMDVAHRVPAFIGSAVHDRLAVWLYDKPGKQRVERRISTVAFGWEVHGTPDLFHELAWSDLDDEERDSVLAMFPNVNKSGPIGVLDDHKTMMSGWGLAKSEGEGRDEYKDQIDLYAHLFRVRGVEIHLARNLWLICHHEQRHAGVGFYPAAPAGKIVQAMRKPDEARAFFEERVSLHRRAMLDGVRDDDLPECSESERWKRPDEWAVYPSAGRPRKDGTRARPIKVFRGALGETEGDALRHKRDLKVRNGKNYRVENRVGESVRCQPAYCDAFQFCTFGKNLRADYDRPEETATPKAALATEGA